MHINNFLTKEKILKKCGLCRRTDNLSSISKKKNKKWKISSWTMLMTVQSLYGSFNWSVQLNLPKHKQQNLSLSQQLNKEKLKTKDPKKSILNLRLLYSLLETLSFSPFKFSVAAWNLLWFWSVSLQVWL